MKRGPKGTPPDVRAMRGTKRPDRTVVPLFTNQPRQEIVDCPAPADMTVPGKAVWAAKVERYRQRGQPVEGFEGALRQYCELEVVVSAMFRGERPLVMSAVAGLRLYAAEFFDTPASQNLRPQRRPDGNPFGRNGRRA